KSAVPSVPSERVAVAGTIEQLDTELNELVAFLPGTDLLGADADELAGLMARLRDDRLTLNKLPILHALREELIRTGLEPLLDELGRRQVDTDTAVLIFEHAWLSSIA